MRFLLVIRGALIAAPANELPVMKIPHAAPTTDKPIAHDIPIADHKYGFIRLKINQGIFDFRRTKERMFRLIIEYF